MDHLKTLSLRARVLVAIALVLGAAAVTGVLFASWHARQSLHEELVAALAGGRQTVASAVGDLPRSDHPAQDLRQLIATFDGNRHVSATLVVAGRPVQVSRPFARAPRAPHWFSAWLDPRLATVRISLPPGVGGYAAILLRPVAENDAADGWLQFRDALAVLTLACLCGIALVYFTIGRALQPLSAMSEAFARLGAGDYAIRVAEAGPRELAQLSRSFNAMTAELAAIRRRNAALEEQILKLQDEERAEIARDLHDEIGPHLFSVNIDAAMAGRSIAAGRPEEAAARVGAIQTAVGHMQRQVKDILSRLRPAQLVELGLAAAVVDLVTFWRGRRPDIAFTVDFALDDCEVSEPLQETIYRVVQESLSNAVRHGRPAHVDVAARYEGGQVMVCVADDGVAGEGAAQGGGHGLIGMRERVEATGGTLIVEQDGRGWSVTARTPAPPAAARRREKAVQ